MNLVLDTNIILLYLRDRESKNFIEKKYGPFKKGNDPIISIVTVGEIRSIVKRNKWGQKRTNAIEQFLKELVIVDIKMIYGLPQQLLSQNRV